eukprot:291070-Rhodomonas_salina.3
MCGTELAYAATRRARGRGREGAGRVESRGLRVDEGRRGSTRVDEGRGSRSRVLGDVRYRHGVWCYPPTCAIRYAMSGTDVGYGATRASSSGSKRTLRMLRA